MPAHALLDHRRPRSAPQAPDRATALYLKGNELRQLGKVDDAIAAYDEALKLRPAFPEALRAGGGILKESGRLDAALRFLDEAIRLKPTYLDAALDRCELLCAAMRFAEALEGLDTALAVRPGHAGLLVNRGVALHGLGRLDEACECLQQAIAADPHLPQAHLNYANALARIYKHEEALPAYDRAIALKPIYPAALNGRGLCLMTLGRFDEAEQAFAAALAQDPLNAHALTNRGKLRLLLGDLDGGFRDYEHRLRTEWVTPPALKHPVPEWSGEDLRGQRIITFADAGIGDVLHYVRYVPMLVAAGADVTVLNRPKLNRLLDPLTRPARLVASVGDDDEFDLQIPFASLPFVFGTRLQTIPASTPYLATEPDRVATWAARIGTQDFRIGLCWRGNQDWRADPTRSIPLGLLQPLAELPNVRLISLQMDEGGEVCAALPLERFDDVDVGLDGFIDTAAIMANLDLIVTIDTSIAHLAGALACPTYVLLQAVPEWRWLLNRDDTPWYPTMRLFRQQRRGDWSQAIERLTAAVRGLVNDKNAVAAAGHSLADR